MTNPANHNKVWDDSERTQLRQMWEDNTALEEMARTLGRTASSVVAMLANMKIVFFSRATESFHIAEPIWSMKEVQTIDKRIKDASPMDPS